MLGLPAGYLDKPLDHSVVSIKYFSQTMHASVYNRKPSCVGMREVFVPYYSIHIHYFHVYVEALMHWDA